MDVKWSKNINDEQQTLQFHFLTFDIYALETQRENHSNL